MGENERCKWEVGRRAAGPEMAVRHPVELPHRQLDL